MSRFLGVRFLRGEIYLSVRVSKQAVEHAARNWCAYARDGRSDCDCAGATELLFHAAHPAMYHCRGSNAHEPARHRPGEGDGQPA